jgi:hypothetical protein
MENMRQSCKRLFDTKSNCYYNTLWIDLQNSSKRYDKPIDGSTFIFTMPVILKMEAF